MLIRVKRLKEEYGKKEKKLSELIKDMNRKLS